MFLVTELLVKRLDNDRIVYKFIFDPYYLDLDDIILVNMLIKAIHDRELAKKIERELSIPYHKIKEAIQNILRKGYKGNNGSIDPALHTAPHIIVNGAISVYNVGLWWCDYGVKGKVFTQDLCTDPQFSHPRRAIALNPFELDYITQYDLDTIIDSEGYHKEGSIGRSPMEYRYELKPTSALAYGTFIANSDTTIKSVLFLGASYSSPNSSTTCSSQFPAPPNTCDPDYYASIYLPIWGWNVNVSISKDTAYSVSLRWYKP